MLWHNNGDGTFTDLSKETGTCATLWGWAAKFGDFDNDGWQDLFVVNGLRSASKENYIPVLVNMITKPGVDFTDVNSWPHIGAMTWSGYQKKKMFHNLGTQAFKEISSEAGVDNDKDGRGILDLIREVRPPFSPEQTVEAFAALLKSYGVLRIGGDRYAGEWPREQFRKRGIQYEPAEKPRSDLYRDLLPLLTASSILLPDNPRLVSQITPSALLCVSGAARSGSVRRIKIRARSFGVAQPQSC